MGEINFIKGLRLWRRRQIPYRSSSYDLNKNNSEANRRAELKALQDHKRARRQAHQKNPRATYNKNPLE